MPELSEQVEKKVDRDLAAENKEADEPIDKYPALTARVKELQKKKEQVLAKSAPHRKQRDELLKRIQPLEDQLRAVNEEIAKAERPHLPAIDNELGALARGMGGRSLQQLEEARR